MITQHTIDPFTRELRDSDGTVIARLTAPNRYRDTEADLSSGALRGIAQTAKVAQTVSEQSLATLTTIKEQLELLVEQATAEAAQAVVDKKAAETAASAASAVAAAAAVTLATSQANEEIDEKTLAAHQKAAAIGELLVANRQVDIAVAQAAVESTDAVKTDLEAKLALVEQQHTAVTNDLNIKVQAADAADEVALTAETAADVSSVAINLQAAEDFWAKKGWTGSVYTPTNEPGVFYEYDLAEDKFRGYREVWDEELQANVKQYIEA